MRVSYFENLKHWKGFQVQFTQILDYLEVYNKYAYAHVCVVYLNSIVKTEIRTTFSKLYLV